MLQPTKVSKARQTEEEAEAVFKSEMARREQQIKAQGGVTDWGMTAEAVDILKSPIATGQAGGARKDKATAKTE